MKVIDKRYTVNIEFNYAEYQALKSLVKSVGELEIADISVLNLVRQLKQKVLGIGRLETIHELIKKNKSVDKEIEKLEEMQKETKRIVEQEKVTFAKLKSKYGERN